MIVLRGDTSHRNRPRGGSSPIGPASAPPRQTAGIVARFARIVSRSIDGSSASRRASLTSIRASRKSISGHDRITPTLICSPRSTRGTMRTIA